MKGDQSIDDAFDQQIWVRPELEMEAGYVPGSRQVIVLNARIL